jgi:hypothetical protein
MPRSTRRRVVSPQLWKMSVAFEDQGEIVPLRGVTKNPPAGRAASVACRSARVLLRTSGVGSAAASRRNT